MTEPGGRHLAYRQILAPTLVALGLLAAPPSATAAHLTFLGAVFDGVAGADGLEHAQDLVVSPDGLHVYVVAEEEHAVALYARDASSGALGFVQKWVDGVDGVDGIENPIGVAVSPDGAHVYATGSFDNGLAAFARDAGTGLLTFVEAKHNDVGGVIGLDNPGDVTLSPDGEHVYVTTWDDWGVVVFARDPATGVLTFVEAEFDGGGATGLINATTVELSPDGKHVYVASEGSDAVAVFARDAGSGELTFVEAEFDGMGGVDGLDGAVSVVVSPDGDHVYVGSLEDDAIATFARNATTGALTFVDATFDNTGDIDGLDRPLALATSADGTKLYVAGSYNDHAVVVFERDPPTGALAFLEVHRNGSGGVTGLIGCNTVRTSPDGKHVYTTARDPGSLAVFATPAGLPTTTSTTPASSTTTVTSTSSTTSSTLPSSTSTTSSTTSSTALSTSTTSSTSSSTTSSTPTTTVSTTLPSTSTIPVSTTSTSIVGSTTTSSTTTTTTSTSLPGSTSTTQTTSTVPASSTTSTTTTPSSTTSTTSTTIVGCTLSPRSDCREAPRTRFAVRNRTKDAKDRLRFRWKRGAATALADFGTPEGDTTYRLCVYRDGALVLEAAVPPGGTCGKRPCWRPTKKGFRYADRSGAADGIKTIVLKSGGDGSAAVGVAGRGEGLPLPPEPLAPPLVVQVQASDAACWGGEVAGP